MKKLLIALVVLMGVSASTFANDHIYFNNLVATDLTVKTMAGLKFRVTGTNLLDKSFVEIKDNLGNTLYKEVVIVENFAKVFDLASLPDGSYKIVLTSGEKTFEKPFDIQTEVKRVAVSTK